VRANYISKWESFATGGGGGSSSSSRGGSGGGSKYDDEYGDDGGDYGDGDGPSGSSSSFRFTHLLSSESELLLWKTEGLPSDELSQQNAIVILHNKQRPPFVIDPSSAASAWLQRRLAAFAAATLERKKGGSSRRNRDAPEQQQSGAGGDFGALEVVPTQHPRFINQVEMALRFGKTLVVTEVDGLEPVLFPIVRRDVVRQGSRLQIFFGDKFVDFHEDFRLFFTTRNPSPSLPPGAEALLTMVNFTVTRSGLEGQLLGAALQHERPELEQQKSELLQQEESFRLQLVKLEDSLLQDLAASEGNLLENVKLIETLTNTKVKAAEIEEALAQASISSRDLDEQREVYRPLAGLGSKIFFLVQQLSRINHMYQFSLGAFVGEFRGTLRSTRSNVVDAGEGGDGDAPRGGGVASRLKDLVPALEHRILYFVGRALFKNDRMMWALHLMHGLREDLFQPPLLWRSFVGELVTAEGESSSSSSSSNFPGSDWVQRERRSALARLCQASPQLVNELDLGNERKWSKWANEREPELCFPSIGTSRTGTSALFTRLLLVQALRPDRLPVAVQISVRDELSVTTILPPPLSMARLEEDELSKQAENGGGIAPVLIITGAGADPSKELSELAADKVGAGRYFELAMGGGQEETALKMIREAAMRGNWLCLKNLHLVTAWLPHLEKALNAMTDASKLDPTNAAGGGAEGGGEMRRRGGKRRKEKLVIHRDFRLFLSAEEHGSFNTSLLQQSLKVTYEAPPGIKKNMQRTYDAWEDAFIAKGSSDRAQILFMLAFMNAVILERRTYVPQGWTKFYEFSLADLRAGAGVIDAAIEGAEAAGRRVPWALIHGLFETAVYGGRIANPFDVQVLRTYLQIFLSDEALRAMSATSARDDAGSKEADDAAASVLRSIIPSDLQLPDSREKDDYVAIIDRLPEVDPPAMFGLPANIERSLQRAKAERVVAQLLILSKSADASVGFNRAEWKQSLGPLLRVWESACAMDATLSQLATGGGGASSSSAQRGGDASKTGDGGGSAGREPPLQQFVQLERATAGVLLSLVHTSLTAIGSVIAGTGLLTPLISANASDLMAGRVPDEWLDVWEAGGEEPSRWLDAAIRRAKALSDWEALFRGSESTFLQKLKQTSLDLGELFNPGAYNFSFFDSLILVRPSL
jgi:dynein heavy chain 2